VERREQTEDLEEILGGVDTTFIDKQGLSENSIISAKDAHIKTLTLYSGARVDKIIKEAIEKGLFEVEVFDLTDIEAKLLLDGGYYIKETTEPRKTGNTIIQVSSWTINWESANSISTEEPKPPLP
jgi:predicted DNA-binding protein